MRSGPEQIRVGGGFAAARLTGVHVVVAPAARYARGGAGGRETRAGGEGGRRSEMETRLRDCGRGAHPSSVRNEEADWRVGARAGARAEICGAGAREWRARGGEEDGPSVSSAGR